MIMTYNAYEKGFLPGAGGIDEQPHLLVPLMATISSALNDEEELDRITRDKKKTMADRSNAMSGSNKGYAPMPVPNKRG